MWLGALLNPFSSRRNNKSCDIFIFYVPFLCVFFNIYFLNKNVAIMQGYTYN